MLTACPLECSNGVHGWKPEYNRASSGLWEVRVALFNAGKIRFCDCPIGKKQLSYMNRVFMEMQKEKDWLTDRLSRVLWEIENPNKQVRPVKENARPYHPAGADEPWTEE